MRQLETADARVDGAGERALHVAEQLRFRQPLGNRGGVEGNEPLVGARAVMVNGPRDELLAGARFALDQHGAVHRGDQLERREQLLHRAVAADDVVEPETVAQLHPQLGVLLPQAPLVDRGLRARARAAASWNGLIRKSMAPRFIAVTASLTPPKPVITTARHLGIACERLVEHLHAVGVGQAQVDDHAVVGKGLEALDAHRRRRRPAPRQSRSPRAIP